MKRIFSAVLIMFAVVLLASCGMETETFEDAFGEVSDSDLYLSEDEADYLATYYDETEYETESDFWDDYVVSSEKVEIVEEVVIAEEPAKEHIVVLYSKDGDSVEVAESEVTEYLGDGWYETKPETKTMYAADGRTINVFESEIASYKNYGWYETESEAKASKTAGVSTSPSIVSNSVADGYYYRTPTGKKYHLDPDCGGKNSYRTNNISGLGPCKKCAM